MSNKEMASKKIGKNNEIRGRNIWLIALFISIFAVLLINTITALLTNMYINNPGAIELTSHQPLTCFWTLNETAQANVTWYRNGDINQTQNNIDCQANQPCSTSAGGNVPALYVSRGDTWKCIVEYINVTGVEAHNFSVLIINSPPTPPKVYLQNGSETTNFTTQLPQRAITIFNVTSTDADGDTITYTLNDTTFCSINANTGALTCNPLLKVHRGLRQLKLGAMDADSAQFITFTINVTPANSPPLFSPALQNQMVLEGHALDYVITATDDEGDVPYNFSMTTNLTSLIIEYISPTSARIRFNNSGQDIANYVDRGNHTVTITVVDSGNATLNLSSASTNASFNLEVVPQNHVPNISIYVYNNLSLKQGGNLSIYVNATDIDNDTITFFTNSPLYNITSGTTIYSFTPGTSFNYGWINITNMSNDYVWNVNLMIIAYDTKQNSTQNITLNVTNVNDPPVIYDLSYSPLNTLTNINITNLSGYTGVLFKYKVNASDIDELTYAKDIITYSTNDSNFPINFLSGIISMTPNVSGNYSFIVTVTDELGATANSTATLRVYPNNNPSFTQDLIIIRCFEYDAANYPNNCIYNVSSNVSDADLGDYIADYAVNSTFFTINPVTGMINFSASQANIGNNSFNITITDSRGGINSTVAYMIINNTNNPPIIASINMPPGRLVVGNSYQIGIIADDQDLSLQNTYENLTFNDTIIGPNVGMFTLIKSSSTTAVMGFSPSVTGDAGNYSINFTVIDFYNNMSAISSNNIFVYNITQPPNITTISPYGSPIINGSVNTGYLNFSDFPGKTTGITINENETYIFNETSIPDMTYSNNLSYIWYNDGNFTSTGKGYSKYFDFFSAGAHNVTLIIADLFNYTNTFSWIITTNNVNRPPQLVTQLLNLTVNGTTTYNNYMTYYNSQTKFYDPDDDPSVTGRTPGNETTLIFNSTPCEFGQISFINSDLKVKTTGVGSCFINFTATDSTNSSLYIISNNVVINITSVSNETSEVPTPLPIASSGGGGGGSQAVAIPLPQDVDKPKPLQIITPKLVTVYRNATIKVPVTLNNTWNDTLEGITLSAYTNATNVTLYLDKVYFPRLYRNQSEEVTLIIGNYKSEGHYEVQITANVTNPKYQDTATIFVNSAEFKSEGDDIENKISFARDLLSSNPECQELTELLNKAKNELTNNNYEGAAKLVDDVVNGCKYLVSNSKNIAQSPEKNFITRLDWNKNYNEYLIIAGFAILFFVALYYVFKKDNPENNI